uniref:Uncharacterized protein n=1 Tax=Arundo donax TaxID=35708 RepID=A0A0A9C802_ARUDO
MGARPSRRAAACRSAPSLVACSWVEQGLGTLGNRDESASRYVDNVNQQEWKDQVLPSLLTGTCSRPFSSPCPVQIGTERRGRGDGVLTGANK